MSRFDGLKEIVAARNPRAWWSEVAREMVIFALCAMIHDEAMEIMALEANP
jgi:hypothetical protein